MGCISREVQGVAWELIELVEDVDGLAEYNLGSTCVEVLGGCTWRDEGEDVHDKELANQWICNGTASMEQSWFEC